MAKQQQPDLPHVSILTDEEISQAICNYAAKKQLGIDPDTNNIDFKVTYRPVKGGLFASIAIMAVSPVVTKPTTASQPDDAK